MKIYVIIAEINRSTNYLGVAKTKDDAETKIRDIFHWAQVEEVAAVDNKLFYKVNEHGLVTVIEEVV